MKTTAQLWQDRRAAVERIAKRAVYACFIFFAVALFYGATR